MMTPHPATLLADDRQRLVAKRRLSPTECRAWLSNHDEGRLSYLSGRGPRSVVVLYTLADKQIVMRLPDYHDAAHYAPGAEVRLDVEGLGNAGRDTVRVIGQAVLADRAPMDALDGVGADPDKESSMVETSVVCLPISHVEGYETDPGYRE
jgi:hypothetical protein